ncbi:hypothetical protein VXJ25_06565 [Olsenella sp. YH-ols2223]|uniref:Uncharacterized protein n=1 Tax=Olsenella absiana TaxID=3115222 RepID=A0ABU7RAS2_9ACTN
MRVAETIILLLLGMIGGIVSVTFDVALVGSPAVLLHFAPWVLVNVILAVHLADAREAVFGAIPLNLGLVETAVLATSMTYEGLSRKILLPMALLALTAPLVSIVAWMARRERHTLFGKLASAMLAAFVLLGCALLYGAPATGDYVCAALVLLLLLVVPTRMLRLCAHVPGGEGADAAEGREGPRAEGDAARRPAERHRPRRTARLQEAEGERRQPSDTGGADDRHLRRERRPARTVERPSVTSKDMGRPARRPSQQPARRGTSEGTTQEGSRRRAAERPERGQSRQRPTAGRQRPARAQERPAAGQQRPARGQQRPSQAQSRPSGQTRLGLRPQRQDRQERPRPTKRTGAQGPSGPKDQAARQPGRREDSRRNRPRG